MSRIIVDVREQSEYANGHIAGALNITPAQIMDGAKALSGVNKDTEIVLYCISGSRSNVASHILRSQGFTNLVNGVNKEQVGAKYGLDII